MKLIIEHSQTKREINGPFNVCGSRADLLWLADQIRASVEEERFVYGWISITETRQPRCVNVAPVPWDQEAACK